jgi:hypothetical protein
VNFLNIRFDALDVGLGYGLRLQEKCRTKGGRTSHTDWDSIYRGADKSLARPTSLCILFDGENISFDASLVIYINSTNIPPILIINKVYETQNRLSL